MASRTAVVFGGVAVEPAPRLRARIGALERPFVVAADGGAASALAFGLVPDVVVGDLDSIAAETLDGLRRRGVVVEAFPRDKDATDGQLALERALAERPGEVLLLGFLRGPRLDHALANVLLLARAPGAVLLEEENECAALGAGGRRRWRPEPGELISLLAAGGDAGGVSTSGLRWALDRATLRFGDTRGLSNEPVADEVEVAIGTGLLLVTRHFPAGRPDGGSEPEGADSGRVPKRRGDPGPSG